MTDAVGRRHRRVVRRSNVDDAAHLQERSGPTPAPSDGPVIPNRAAEDCDSVWGDDIDSNDRRLKDDVPPHW